MKRRPMPEQGSMLKLMGERAPIKEVAITRLEEDAAGNITLMSHEPVPEDGSEDDGFWASFMANY